MISLPILKQGLTYLICNSLRRSKTQLTLHLKKLSKLNLWVFLGHLLFWSLLILNFLNKKDCKAMMGKKLLPTKSQKVSEKKKDTQGKSISMWPVFGAATTIYRHSSTESHSLICNLKSLSSSESNLKV